MPKTSHFWEDMCKKFRINGQFIVDGGDIDADDELQNAFPELDGSNILLRKLSISTYGNFYDTVDFKIGIERHRLACGID